MPMAIFVAEKGRRTEDNIPVPAVDGKGPLAWGGVERDPEID